LFAGSDVMPVVQTRTWRGRVDRIAELDVLLVTRTQVARHRPSRYTPSARQNQIGDRRAVCRGT